MADGGFHAVHTIPMGAIQVTAGSEADIAIFLDRLMAAVAGRDLRTTQQMPIYSAQEMAERADEYADLLGRIAVSLENIEHVMKAFVGKVGKAA